MEYVHFLNLEYIVLKFRDLFNSLIAYITGTPLSVVETQGPASTEVTTRALDSIYFFVGQIALLGTAVAVILLAAAVYVRIKLEIVEHEGFHGHGGHEAHSAHGEGQVPREVPEENGVPLTTTNNKRFEDVVILANSTNESDWRRAIMEADIMLGQALESAGYRGGTVGERLKDANPLQMTTLDLAWAAHKVRNDIAHQGESHHLSSWDVRGTIDSYRRVFEELGYIQ